MLESWAGMSDSRWQYHLGFFAFVGMGAARNVLSADILRTTDALFFTFLMALFVVVFAMLARLWRVGTDFQYNLKAAAPILITLSCTTCVGILGSNMALARMSPVLISFIDVTFYPVAASVIAYWFAKGETVRLEVIIPTLLIATFGMILFSSSRIESTDRVFISASGLAWELISVIGWASSVVMATNLVRQGTTILDVIGFRFGATVIALGAWLIVNPPVQQETNMLPIALIALLTYFFPYILSFSGLRKLSVVTFAMYTMLSPIMTYVLAGILWSEWELTTLQLIGAGLIFIALVRRTYNEYMYSQPIQSVSV